ncbi:MAG: SIMPL domain-containing protein [Proteobacteria bacterium]|nr:SIMPL domain-containing protein [Pseudomonadota bacterium]
MRNTLIMAACLFGSIALSVGAHELDPRFDRIAMSVSAEREVDNDTLVAVLFSEHQAQQPRSVSQEVNSAIRWALEKAKQIADVKVQTTQYNTSPIYNKQAITGWRARQSIRLESTNAQTMSELIGELQERLSIESVSYTVSKTARDRVEEALISEALALYRRRAELVAQEFGRKSYRIVELNIDAAGGRPEQFAYAARGIATQEMAAAPAIEAGVQTVTVNVSGNIEIDAEPR